MRRNGSWRDAAALVAALTVGAFVTAGCNLTEVEVERPEDVIFAEAWAVLRADPAGGLGLDAFAFLHRTFGADELELVPEATVRLSGESGRVVHMAERDIELCVHVIGEVWPKVAGSCYRTWMSPSPFAPGERLVLEITTQEGRRLVSASRVPGALAFQDLTHQGGRCRLEPETNYRFAWTPAQDAWAYLADARIEGLGNAFVDAAFEVPDSLYVGGRSLGREDTGIVFPRHFGLLDFITNENRDLIRALQGGLPDGGRAEIALTAADRNWTNWVRGEALDPTRPSRIPSVSGDGTGWFGTATQQRVQVAASPGGEGQPPLCGPAYVSEPAGLFG